jgi:hypothetical protein
MPFGVSRDLMAGPTHENGTSYRHAEFLLRHRAQRFQMTARVLDRVSPREAAEVVRGFLKS